MDWHASKDCTAAGVPVGVVDRASAPVASVAAITLPVSSKRSRIFVPLREAASLVRVSFEAQAGAVAELIQRTDNLPMVSVSPLPLSCCFTYHGDSSA